VVTGGHADASMEIAEKLNAVLDISREPDIYLRGAASPTH
jgi:hypothetical protein